MHVDNFFLNILGSHDFLFLCRGRAVNAHLVIVFQQLR
jgi:hypothetical protein